MQSVCSPTARCWDSMYNIMFKANLGLGVPVTPHHTPAPPRNTLLENGVEVKRGENLLCLERQHEQAT